MTAKKPPPTFILLGAAGYIAPRHMAAIKEIGGDLVAAVDPCDSVGILDSYFPKCQFYKKHIDCFDKVKADYVVICTPNALHAVQACHAMRAGMNVIVEKPAAVLTEMLDRMVATEHETGKRVFCILNMRLHHDAKLLRSTSRHCLNNRAVVDIEYHTPRGPWYHESWKSDASKSGGLLFNIGIHLIDLAALVFGPKLFDGIAAWDISASSAFGSLSFEFADVNVSLSINGQPKKRIFRVNGAEFDFTSGFEDLHTESYRRILNGWGYTLSDARPSIELCERITNANRVVQDR